MRRKSLTDFGWRIDYCEIFCCQITDHIGVNSTSYSRKNTGLFSRQYCKQYQTKSQSEEYS